MIHYPPPAPQGIRHTTPLLHRCMHPHAPGRGKGGEREVWAAGGGRTCLLLLLLLLPPPPLSLPHCHQALQALRLACTAQVRVVMLMFRVIRMFAAAPKRVAPGIDQSSGSTRVVGR